MPLSKRTPSHFGLYHVMGRGNNKADVFHRQSDYAAYLSLLKRAATFQGFTLHHFALMPNHIHLLVHADTLSSLAEAMKFINFRYSLYHRHTYGNVGHVWQGRYRSIPIVNRGHALTCGIYIELNPVRAGLCATPLKWRWSSHHHYATRRLSFVQDSPAFLDLGTDDAARRESYAAQTKLWSGLKRGERHAATRSFLWPFKPDRAFLRGISSDTPFLH